MLLGIAAGTAASKAGTYAKLWNTKTKQDIRAKRQIRPVHWPFLL